jgi:RNase P/RNase MRP subunit p30
MDLVLKKTSDIEKRAKLLGAEFLLISEPNDFKQGGLLVRASKPKEIVSARKLAKRAQFVVADSNDEQTIRFIMEQKWINAFTNISTSTGRDHTHYRRSNFNQVLAKIAKETGKTYIIDFSHILEITGKKRALLLGRIMQNIRICQKYKVPISIATFATSKDELRNPKDLQALLRAFKTKKLVDILEMIK